MASASLEPDQQGDATQQDDKTEVDLMSYFKSLTGKNAINMYLSVVEVYINHT